MVPWRLLDTATLPGGGDLVLRQRGDEFSIRLAGNELMNSRRSASEEALAELALEVLARKPRRAPPHVLIGGLGMGFTLRAALARLGPDATVVVAELIPAVIAWAHGPLAPLFGESLADPRLALEAADVAVLIRAARARFDAILLDVDNGPDGLTVAANEALYGIPGLATARAALRPGGALAIWSAAPDPRFTARMRQAGFGVAEHRVRARTGAGSRHTIWIGTA